MRKKCWFLLYLLVMIFTLKVNAQIYYTNENGVVLTKEEYEFISEVFYEGFQNLLNKEDYINIFSDDISNSKITTNSSYALLDTSHTTSSKTIKIASSCSTDCLVTVVVDWLKTPVVRSYDLIGARFVNTSLTSTPVTYVSNSTDFLRSTEMVNFSNGFGVSVKLIPNGDDMHITQYFRVSKGGTVYASYQHAVNTISLSISKRYTISSEGAGGVFLFDNTTILNFFDQMKGVYI